MTPEQFRGRFDDLGAGFIDWSHPAEHLTVVGCRVYESSRCEGGEAWLAAAGVNRAAAGRILKNFGVHGLKFNARASGLVPGPLIAAAAANPGKVVALVPGSPVAVFPSDAS